MDFWDLPASGFKKNSKNFVILGHQWKKYINV